MSRTDLEFTFTQHAMPVAWEWETVPLAGEEWNYQVIANIHYGYVEVWRPIFPKIPSYSRPARPNSFPERAA